MAKLSDRRSNELGVKEYIALGFSLLALCVSGAGFYFQFLEKSYDLYVGVSNVRISLASPLRPAATFLFLNRGNQQAVILKLSADIYPATENFSTDNCKLPQIQRVATLPWKDFNSASGTVEASPILLKPNDIAAYNVEFSGLSQNEIARAMASGHGSVFFLVCWSAAFYSKTNSISIQHFAATVGRFDAEEQLQELRTPTSLLTLRQ